jgi:uncharacterized protein YggE
MIKNRYFWITVVVLVAAVGTTVATLVLSADEPESLADAVATHNAAIGDTKYCDARGDGISVQGTGILNVPATIGVVLLGVEVTSETVSAARAEAAEAMIDVIEAVREQGVDEDDITTTRFNIWPVTTWIEEELDLGEGRTESRSKDILIGYRVTNQVRIEINMTDKSKESDIGKQEDGSSEDADTSEDGSNVLSKIIDAAADAGGDDVRIDAISFEADPTSELVDEARKLAVHDALHRARFYADAFGVEIGTLLSASENVDSRPVLFQDAAVARVESYGYASPGTPVDAGDIELRTDIVAKFAITQPGCVDKTSMAKNGDTK